ncbi:peptidylprolyl isomerase [Dokdonella sp.]|uniref:peptidylprolyl isomerase n=1 Tax=Dokdonella sp. TaxID=2291710 RepID=UPI003C333F5A
MHTFVRMLLPAVALILFASSANAQDKYPPETVVAKRGDAVVTMLDVDAALLGVPARLRANVMNNPKRIEELIEGLLINQQLALEGQELGLDDNAVFQQAVALQRYRMLGEQRLIAYRTSMDLGDVEELARERYMVNPDAYAIPGSASVRHILVDTKSRSEEDALELAKEVHAKAVAGSDFVVLVKEYSDDPSKESNEGLIPNAESDGLDPAFAAAVKDLKTTGEISRVVKTQFGYHVIVLVQRMPSKPRSFDQVKEKIIGELEGTMRDARVQEHVDSLKGIEIEAVPEVVASLRTRYLPESEVQAVGDKSGN